MVQVGPKNRLEFEIIDIVQDETCMELCDFLNANYSQVAKKK